MDMVARAGIRPHGGGEGVPVAEFGLFEMKDLELLLNLLASERHFPMRSEQRIDGSPARFIDDSLMGAMVDLIFSDGSSESIGPVSQFNCPIPESIRGRFT